MSNQCIRNIWMPWKAIQNVYICDLKTIARKHFPIKILKTIVIIFKWWPKSELIESSNLSLFVLWPNSIIYFIGLSVFSLKMKGIKLEFEFQLNCRKWKICFSHCDMVFQTAINQWNTIIIIIRDWKWKSIQHPRHPRHILTHISHFKLQTFGVSNSEIIVLFANERVSVET